MKNCITETVNYCFLFLTWSCILLSIPILPNSACNILDVAKLGYEQYQYIVINGNIVQNMPPSNGQQPEKRYEIIESILKLYQRPFTMLDIGAAQGYHSLRAAWQFPNSVFVMIEGNNNVYPLQGDQLLSICKCNTKLNNIIHLNKSIFVDDLVNLGECEHFDVVLALNILHWLGDQWKKAIEALLYLGDHIIIEIPPPEGSQTCMKISQYLVSIGAEKIAEVPRHLTNQKAPIFLLKSDQSKILTKSTWFSSKVESGKYTIISNFVEKKLKKLDTASNPCKEFITTWHPGINLITFKMYNGVYPLVKTLKQELYKWKNELHNDWQPNNFIVQGNQLKMIDYNSIYFINVPTQPTTYSRYNKMLNFLEATDPKKIRELFLAVLGSIRDQIESN